MKHDGMMFVLIALLAAGCASSPVPRQYVFAPTEGWRAVAVRDAADRAYVIRFAPVQLPAYIDRPHIITRINDHEIRAAQLHRWGMPLQTTMIETMGAAMGRDLPEAYIDVLPVRNREAEGYLVDVYVVRLDGIPGGKVELIAQWKLMKTGEQKEVIVQRLGHYSHETVATGYEAYVEAVRQAILAMGHDIAAAVRADRSDHAD